MVDFSIRTARPGDEFSIAAIYNHYIENSVVSFETEPLLPTVMKERIDGVAAGGYPFLVGEIEGQVVGQETLQK